MLGLGLGLCRLGVPRLSARPGYELVGSEDDGGGRRGDRVRGVMGVVLDQDLSREGRHAGAIRRRNYRYCDWCHRVSWIGRSCSSLEVGGEGEQHRQRIAV